MGRSCHETWSPQGKRCFDHGLQEAAAGGERGEEKLRQGLELCPKLPLGELWLVANTDGGTVSLEEMSEVHLCL